jgi:hypothetical protein
VIVKRIDLDISTESRVLSLPESGKLAFGMPSLCLDIYIYIYIQGES